MPLDFNSMRVSLIDEWEKPCLRTSPDHFFGTRGAICFAYKEGNLLHADCYSGNTYIYVNGEPLIEIPNIAPSHVHHSRMFHYYSQATGTITNKYDWIRGRVGNDGTNLNLWGNVEKNQIADVCKMLKKYSVLNKQGIYIVGTTDRTGSKLYEVSSGEDPAADEEHTS